MQTSLEEPESNLQMSFTSNTSNNSDGGMPCKTPKALLQEVLNKLGRKPNFTVEHVEIYKVCASFDDVAGE
jgi:hypothetical protein